MSILLKNKPLKDIALSTHALERAKQRMDLKVDPRNLEFEFKLKALMQQAEFREILGNKIRYELIYDHKKYDIVANALPNGKLLINTIIGKDKNNNEY